MRLRPVRFFLSLVVVTLLLAVTLVYLAFDRRPTVERAAVISPEYIARARAIIDANNPRRLRNGAIRTASVTAADLDIALNYLAQRYASGGAAATMDDRELHLTFSVRAPWIPTSAFVNLTATLVEGTPLPTLGQVWMGQLPVPRAVTTRLLERVAGMSFTESDRRTIIEAAKGVDFSPDEVRFTYQWHEDVGQTVRGALVQAKERERLEVYQRTLVEATARARTGVSMVNLLTPLFVKARERSPTSDAVAENRAAILILTFYVVGLPLREIAPEAAAWPVARRVDVALNQRGDSVQHFMVSAMLAANTGGPFADAVGLYKEIVDSRGGSGFSFNDLAADRAGRRFGQMAENPNDAARLQSRIAGSLRERDLMPAAADLPEGLSEAEFNRQFGGLKGSAYAALVADIDRRVASLSLFR